MPDGNDPAGAYPLKSVVNRAGHAFIRSRSWAGGQVGDDQPGAGEASIRPGWRCFGAGVGRESFTVPPARGVTFWPRYARI